MAPARPRGPGAGPGTILGLSLIWLPLAVVYDAVTVLYLPVRLAADVPGDRLATTLGLISFAGLAVATLLLPAVGLLGDRLGGGPRRVVVVAAGTAATVAAMLVLGLPGGVLAVAAGFVALQAGAAIAQAGAQAWLPEVVDRARRGAAAGARGLLDVGGAFVGFALIGALVGGGQAALVPPLVVALLVIGSAAAIAVATRATTAARVPPSLPTAGATAPAAVPAPGPELVRLAAARFLFLFGIFGVGRFLVLLLAGRLELPAEEAAETAALWLAVLTLTTAVLAIPSGWLSDRLGRRPVMAAGSAAAATGVVALAFAAGPAAVAAGGLLMAGGAAAFGAANWAGLADAAARGAAGRDLGIGAFAGGLAAAAAGLLGPVIDLTRGFTVPLLIAAAAIAASWLVVRGLPSASRASLDHSELRAAG